MSQYLLFSDVESGGLDASTTSLLTAAFILTDIKAVEKKRWDITVAHDVYKVSAGALNVNKIDIAKHHALANPQTMLDMIDYLAKLKAGGNEIILCCHNVMFDSKFLFAQYPQLQKILSYHFLCTVSLAVFLKSCGTIKPDNVKLETLAKYFGLEYGKDGAHNALVDTEMCLEVYKCMMKLCRPRKKKVAVNPQEALK